MEKQLAEYKSKFLLDPNFNISRFDFAAYDKLAKEKKLKIRRGAGDDLWLVSDEVYTVAELRRFAEQLSPPKK